MKRFIPVTGLALLAALGLVLWGSRASRPDAAVLFASGRTRLDALSFVEAQRDFEAALELEPGSARTHTFLAMSLAGQGELEEAFEHLRRAVELDPGYLTAHYNLGMLLLRNDQLDEAERCLLVAQGLSPSNVKVVDALERLQEARRARAPDGE